MGMYALKHRQKSFHNAKIKTKEFKKGDLVLAYTLKQHASKLKKRGLGPYVVHDIPNKLKLEGETQQV